MSLQPIETTDGTIYGVTALVYLTAAEVEGLTTEQLSRLNHHIDKVCRRVFAASVAGMVKGVRKYPAEPMRKDQAPYWRDNAEQSALTAYWFPHIFSEAVDCANQTGLFADALGVEL